MRVGTPLGPVRGRIKLVTTGERLLVDLDAPVIGRRRLEGSAEGDSFNVKGAWWIFPFGRVEYVVEGAVNGDDIALTFKTNRGNTKAVGSRI